MLTYSWVAAGPGECPGQGSAPSHRGPLRGHRHSPRHQGGTLLRGPAAVQVISTQLWRLSTIISTISAGETGRGRGTCGATPQPSPPATRGGPPSACPRRSCSASGEDSGQWLVVTSGGGRGNPWNNGKEVPRWGVAEIQKMSPSPTWRCK